MRPPSNGGLAGQEDAILLLWLGVLLTLIFWFLDSHSRYALPPRFLVIFNYRRLIP